ncbi:four helix bundle protein [Patescibacteria group bacterium]|nr:four helix bundle protein [Patescibacteria group bacterium]MBU1895959.1 four helix bundle protein [Patescibacteria group bacterium]
MQTYKDLIVWQKSIELNKEIYRITSLFPTEEKFGLTSQMRRSSVSIASNIAEGYARRNTKENAYFINIAYGSATELETQIIITKDIRLINKNEFTITDGLLESTLKLLYNYRKYLKS